MNTDPRLEQRVTAAFNKAASTREPDGLLDSVLSTVGRTRTRPRWLALIKEPPMRIHSRVAVGSPTARLAYLFLLIAAAHHPRDRGGRGRSLAAAGARSSWSPRTARAPSRPSPRPSRWPRTATRSWSSRGPTTRASPSPRTSRSGVTAIVGPSSSSSPARWPVTAPTGLGDEHVHLRHPLDESDAHVENITVRGRRRCTGEIPIGAVVIDGGAPVIEKVDVVLDGDP